MKKKLFAILMCLAMMLTFMPATAFAEGEDGGGSGTEFNAWLKWTEVNIPGNDPVIIAEVEGPEDAEISYSWKYRPSDADPDAAWEDLDEHNNMLELTAGSGEGQYVCCVTASKGEDTIASAETETWNYEEPGIAVADSELSIDQSVDMQIMKGWPTECFKFVPDEEGEYSFSFAPSDDSTDLPAIMCMVFDARGVQRGSCEAQPGEPVNTNWLDKDEAAYVAFFIDDEEATGTYAATISVVKAGDGGDDSGEDDGDGYEGDYEGSFDFNETQYYYGFNEFADGEYAKEVVKGDTLTLSPFEAYRFWYLDDKEEEVTVDNPAELFGEAFTYEWTRQNDEGEWEQICDSAAYTKENAAESDAGYYECKVSYNNGDNDEELLYLNARVDIFNSVEIGGETYTYRLDPSWEARVLGQEATLNTGVEFRDSRGESVEPESLFSKIEWYRLTEEDGEKKETLVSGSGYDISPDGSLHIDKVTGEDYGEYICRMYYDNENNIETASGLTSALSQDMQTYVGLSELKDVGNPNLIYSGFTNATPGAKLTYQWYYRDLDSDDPAYTGDEEGAPIDGETGTSIEPKYGNRYYHCNITASMKGYGEDTTGSNLNYETEIPVIYLDPSSLSFTDGTGGSITDTLDFNERESEYYSFKPAANKVYELTATCNSAITDTVEVAVSRFDSNGVRLGKDENDGHVNCTIDPSEAGTAATAVPVLTFESGSTADPVYFAASISGSGSGSADVSLEITATGDVPVYHVVEFETDNNDIMPSQLVKDGEKLTPESEPGKEGYNFDGWYKDAGCTAAFDLDTAITADTTLYAKWTKEKSGTDEEVKPAPVVPATVTIEAAKLPLKTKQKVNAAANLDLPAGVTVTSVTSSNKKVLTVSGTTLRGKKNGKAKVTVTLSNGTTVSYVVTVQTGKVKAKITGVPKKLTLHVGEKYQINADKGYVTCKDKLKYTSSKKKVAKVSKKGLIAAKKNGTTKITVKCGSKKKTIKVKVIP